jgi:serralysin
MLGGADDDEMHGNQGADTLIAQDGADTIFGDAGNDALYGGAGNDQIIGGAGRDTMSGEAGFDFFIFDSIAESSSVAWDRIDLFDASEDVISLLAIDADGTYGSYDKFSYVGNAPVAGIKGQLWITSGANSMYSVFGDVNGDGLAEMRIDVHAPGGFGVENILL